MGIPWRKSVWRVCRSVRARREIGRERREIGVADLRLAERRHHRYARADERLRDGRNEVRALLERRGLLPL